MFNFDPLHKAKQTTMCITDIPRVTLFFHIFTEIHNERANLKDFFFGKLR